MFNLLNSNTRIVACYLATAVCIHSSVAFSSLPIRSTRIATNSNNLNVLMRHDDNQRNIDGLNFEPIRDHRVLLRRTQFGKSLHAGKQDKTSFENDINVETEGDDMGILSTLGFVIPLLLVYISNQWSRSSLYYLVDFSSISSQVDSVISDVTAIAPSFYAMNIDIGFDQAQYGALASIAFTALFAITSLFAGSLADKYNRKYLTIGSTLVWAIATYTTSIATSYEEILISRIIMGLGCAFTTPCAYTLLKDVVSSKKISLANSLYGSGVYFGGGLSSLSILLDDNFGWRTTCSAIATYGFGAALLTTLVLPNDPKENVRAKEKEMPKIQGNDDEKSKSFIDDVRDIVTSNKRLQLLFMGSFLRFCSGLCIGVWAAPYYKLAFPDDASSYGVINAFIVGICGVSSGLIGGIVSDKSVTYMKDKIAVANAETDQSNLHLDENGARLIVPIVGSLLAVPTWWLTSHASTFDSAMFWLAVEYLVAECWFGPTVAVLQSEVKKGQGGTAQGLFTLTGAIGNLAPSLLGILYSSQMAVTGNEVTANSDVLSTLLGVGVCGGYLSSAIFFSLCAMSSKPESYNSVKST